MFDENFSFASPRSPSTDSSTVATQNSSRSVSPCTTSELFPSPRFSVTDLAAQFAGQRLQRDSLICYDSCEAYANNDDDAAWSIPGVQDRDQDSLRRSQTFPQPSNSPTRREQRLANSRLLCTTLHHRDIAALVTRMVDSEDQCCISPAELLTSDPDEDEGYNSSDDATAVDSRRSSIATVQSRTEHRRIPDLTNGGACVNKSIRLRKRNHRRAAPRNTERAS